VSGLLVNWHDLDAAERLARLWSLRVAVRILAGGAGSRVEDAITAAEADVTLLPAADAALDTLPTITSRRVLATFAATLPADHPNRRTTP